MDGYWADEAATADAVVDGWMRTGDLVTIDADGYCAVVGRKKDIIIRGGENIAPREVEDTLFRHVDVEEASVVPVPDEKYGELPCACVRLRAGAEPTDALALALRGFCKERLAHFKVPAYVRFVESFPLTASGKIQKYKLADESRDALGLGLGACGG